MFLGALWRSVYESYSGDEEHHKLRTLGIFGFSIILSVFGTKSVASTYSGMSLSISVLAGFCFTALFSPHAITTHGLRKAMSESDRYDIERLKVLGLNFRLRTTFFITIAIIDLVLMLLGAIDLSWPDFLTEFHASLANVKAIFVKDLIDLLVDSFVILSRLMCVLIVLLSYFLFFESLYTFYRLSETILAIMELRRAYIETESERE